MSEPIERYKGNFWSLKELRDFMHKQFAKKLNSEQQMLDNSNEQRMKRRKQKERQHDVLDPATGNVTLRGAKGKNGCKLIKRFSI